MFSACLFPLRCCTRFHLELQRTSHTLKKLEHNSVRAWSCYIGNLKLVILRCIGETSISIAWWYLINFWTYHVWLFSGFSTELRFAVLKWLTCSKGKWCAGCLYCQALASDSWRVCCRWNESEGHSRNYTKYHIPCNKFMKKDKLLQHFRCQMSQESFPISNVDTSYQTGSRYPTNYSHFQYEVDSDE